MTGLLPSVWRSQQSHSLTQPAQVQCSAYVALWSQGRGCCLQSRDQAITQSHIAWSCALQCNCWGMVTRGAAAASKVETTASTWPYTAWSCAMQCVRGAVGHDHKAEAVLPPRWRPQHPGALGAAPASCWHSPTALADRECPSGLVGPAGLLPSLAGGAVPVAGRQPWAAWPPGNARQPCRCL